MTEEPIRAVRGNRDEQSEAQIEEEEEGAVGGVVEPVIPASQWGDISALERMSTLSKPKQRPDGVEVVEPYRWPADQRPGESIEAYESRLAEFELDRFLRLQEPMTSVALEKLRAAQRRELEKRQPPSTEERGHGEPGASKKSSAFSLSTARTTSTTSWRTGPTT